eukprot:gene4120-750_t
MTARKKRRQAISTCDFLCEDILHIVMEYLCGFSFASDLHSLSLANSICYHTATPFWKAMFNNTWGTKKSRIFHYFDTSVSSCFWKKEIMHRRLKEDHMQRIIKKYGMPPALNDSRARKDLGHELQILSSWPLSYVFPDRRAQDRRNVSHILEIQIGTLAECDFNGGLFHLMTDLVPASVQRLFCPQSVKNAVHYALLPNAPDPVSGDEPEETFQVIILSGKHSGENTA